MKNSELIQLYVLLNKFRDEYISEDDVRMNTSFDIVDDCIDNKLQGTLVELEHSSI